MTVRSLSPCIILLHYGPGHPLVEMFLNEKNGTDGLFTDKRPLEHKRHLPKTYGRQTPSSRHPERMLTPFSSPSNLPLFWSEPLRKAPLRHFSFCCQLPMLPTFFAADVFWSSRVTDRLLTSSREQPFVAAECRGIEDAGR